MSWRSLTIAAAAVLSLVTTSPRVAAAEDPPPPSVETRAGTEAPAEVSGLAEPAPAGDAVAAAEEHLTDPRYHIDPADLVPLHTVVDGADETVRFAQRHRGLPVVGGQYLVHFRTDGGERRVIGAGGRFLTELDVDPTPRITAEQAGRLARATLVKDRASVRVIPGGGLVVVPDGKGVLAWKVTLTGADPVKKKPVLLEAYVDARSGRPLFAVDRLRGFEGSVVAGGQTARGRTVPLQAYQRADGVYELRDRSRPMWNGVTGEILTHDAAGADVMEIMGVPPTGLKLAESPTQVFGPQHTDTGAVDAHWGAGQIYEYYRKLGREGLDGRGGTMHSVVNVTARGEPYVDAFWDGFKMVYGGGYGDYYTLAASLDIVGHEMTHAVIEHSADLLYLNQSGAINEGLADYFGNAAQLDVLGIPMSDPDASLVGEDACRTGPPIQCAARDLDEDRRLPEDYLGVVFDNGGVHFNSTIFSGALWEVREQLGARFDRVVYKALTEYMTPLDDFADGRRAVESAARAAGLSVRDRLTVARAFDRRGIRSGWERQIRVDSRVVVDHPTYVYGPPALAGDRYAMTNAAPDPSGPTAIFTGRLRGGPPVRLSDDDGRSHSLPATDGTRVGWTAFAPGRGTYQILTRPLDRSRPAAVVHETAADVIAVEISGDTVAWTGMDPATGEFEVWLKRGAAAPVNLTAAAGVQGESPSIAAGRLAYLRITEEGAVPVVRDLATGAEVVPAGAAPSLSYPPAAVMTSRYVLWLVDADGDGRSGIMRANADGSGVTPLVPDGPEALLAFGLDANDEVVTVSSAASYVVTNETVNKLYQLPITGGTPARYSCNSGEQVFFASGERARVLWLDGSAGDVDLVTRDRPARRC
ncbi:M4 family metallopeptidase [Nonomuraea sp. SYSU D8015]|uniref:M4 family metallopeptidase n=1 Tax=Nonomuraea sp. SYSU D8015 TaxID=2593644 RepID=UPI00166188A6|nr:M4 family metallopeptidase [Nonomuraea sp. SYSU D8015]